MNYEKVKYKYVLKSTEGFNTFIKGVTFEAKFFSLQTNGVLQVYDGYCWDGCSSIAIDDKTNMRAGLGHDAGYQAIREGLLSPKYRKQIDKMFYRTLRQDGMPWIRAQYYYRAVRVFGSKYALPKQE